MTTQILANCLCCDSKNLFTAFDLGCQPLANSYLQSSDQIEEIYPLGINYCDTCGHLQLTHAVDPDLLFKNYLYVSGTTKTLRDYFDNFVLLTQKYTGIKKNLYVLDIACNDGSQLDSFKKLGYNTFGIDPAENLFSESSKKHTIICDYFNSQSLNKLNQNFDIIVAQNVFAHNTYPLEFLKAAKEKLKPNGYIFIQTSQAKMIEYGQFDTIYHEHISFFSTKSMSNLIQRAGLYLHDCFTTPIHGTSYVFVITSNPDLDNSHIYQENNHIEAVRTKKIITDFVLKSKKCVENIKNSISSIRKKGLPIIGYGAAAKGNTVLNYGKITLDYIVDDNPLKQHLYTPGQKIEIVSLDYINQIYGTKSVCWLPLSWNFFYEIKQKIISQRPQNNDTFINFDFSIS